MGQKASVKNQVVEALMEAQAFCENLSGDIAGIELNIAENEKLDHQNDKLTKELQQLLLDALTAYSAKDYGKMEACVRAAMQKSFEQEKLDLQDDHPRCDIRLGCASFRLKGVNLIKEFQRLQERLR
jgi:hypothetical protein